MRKIVYLALSALLFMAGCSDDLALAPLDYPVQKTAPGDALVAVIDAATQQGIYPIKGSFTAGLRAYYAQPGVMLRQAADHDLGAMFGHYVLKDSFATPDSGQQRLTLVLEIPSFKFTDGVIDLQVDAKLFGPDRKQLLHKVYPGKGGDSQHDFAGIGLEAVIERSSAQAYRQVFEAIRVDLAGILQRQEALAHK
ncbi:hypothetical protein SAMN07250955_106125 [Arboricoccus pini]|uniref:Lipoprotein n=1 Tax=Arboricoccus pini TaxID=1963835 RepID=A0A212R7F0_9PROT|nr:hypothetical protein [Arboricoccus pini]SNB68082.1 hypothetical protein SAMN07250955_106125 [Arboricoccus pini]